MFSECESPMESSVRNQGHQCPNQRTIKSFNETRIPHITIGIKTLRTITNVMIQSMAIAQQPDPVDVHLSQTQPVPNIQTGFPRFKASLASCRRIGQTR